MERRDAGRVSLYPWFGLFAVAAVVLASGGYALYRHEAAAMRADRQSDLRAIADLKCAQISRWRIERLTDARLHGSGIIRSDAVDWLRRGADARDAAGLQARLRLIRDLTSYDSVILAAPDGAVLLGTEASPATLEPMSQAVVRQAAAAGGAVLGELFTCSQCQRVHLDVAAPVLGDGGDAVAVLLLRSDPADYLYPLVQSWPTPSRTAETVLLRRDGDAVLLLNPLRHRSDPPMTVRFGLAETAVPAVQAAAGVSGDFLGLDYRGVAVMADLRPVPGSPWFLVTKMDTEEILAEARYHGRSIALLVLALVLLVAAGMAMVYKHRGKRLYQAMLGAERRRRESDAEVRATLYGIGDGVIATDAAGRVTRMNPEAERLTGWTEPTAVGRALEAVFRIVNEETRAPVESPVQHVLREGTVVGLANHTMLIDRSGNERPIADSGAPIRNEDGVLVGVVLVFRDQTADRAAERELRDSEARFRLLAEEAPDGIFIQTNQRFAYVNPAALRCFGATSAEQLVGKPVLERFHAEFRERVVARIRRLNEDRLPVPAVVETFLRLDGSPFDAEVSAVPFVHEDEDGALVFFRDVSGRLQDRKRLQEQLEELQRWRTVTLGREQRILELKAEVNGLLRQLGQVPRYGSVDGVVRTGEGDGRHGQ